LPPETDMPFSGTDWRRRWRAGFEGGEPNPSLVKIPTHKPCSAGTIEANPHPTQIRGSEGFHPLSRVNVLSHTVHMTRWDLSRLIRSLSDRLLKRGALHLSAQAGTYEEIDSGERNIRNKAIAFWHPSCRDGRWSGAPRKGMEYKPRMLSRNECTESSPPATLSSLTTQEIFNRIHPPCHGLHPIIRFVFQSEGKRLRPRLFYLSARLFHNPTPYLAEAATLIEALHNGTLLHDDVMDRARVRRNRPTVNRLWGDSVAILAGDFLLATVMDLALRTRHASILPLAVETLIQLVEGQMMELQNQGNLSMNESTSMEIIRKKTASLFAMACKLGGILGRGETDQVRALESFGRHLGIAFQLLDDIQDYTSSQDQTGKEPGRDLAEAKVTLPVLAAFRQADRKLKKRIRHIFSDSQRGNHFQELTFLLQDLGGFAYAYEKAVHYVEKAVCALDIVPPCEEKTELEQTAWRIFKENTPRGCGQTPNLTV